MSTEAQRKADLITELYPEDTLRLAEKLTLGELEVLKELRTALEKHLRPYVSEYWENGQFYFDHFKKVLADVKLINDPRIISTSRPYPFTYSQQYFFFFGYEMARFDASTATFFGVHAGLGYYTFLLGGNDEQRARWIEKLQNFELQTCFALTEPLHGSDVAAGLETVAKRDGDKWILNGEKRWIGGASSADVIPVFAKDADSGEVKCFVVEKGQEGLTVEDIKGKVALRIVQNGHITLKDVVVKEENRLQNINSFKDVARILYLTRSGVANTAAGMMGGALAATLKYVTSRKQFGKTISNFQLVQEKLAMMQANVTAAIALCSRIADLQEEGKFDEVNTSIGKMFNALRLRETVALGRGICGGNGITLEEDIIRFFADAEAIYTYEGSHEMNALIIGRHLTGQQAFI